jgi:hypothetical protein
MTSRENGTLSPYVAGAGIGLLSWWTFATAKKPLGVTTPFESTAAAIAQKVAPRATHVNDYLARSEHPPAIDWAWMLTAGIALGSYFAGPKGTSTDVPQLWAKRFGTSRSLRNTSAFLGGALMMFGARMAKGCTSGHAISGNLQFAASSWLFSGVFGATSVAVAKALFGGVR